jgi:acyl carrier protein
MMTIKQNIIEFIEEKTHCPVTNLSDSLLGTIKSFDFMMLIIELEQKFNIKLPFEQALSANVRQIDEFIRWVELHHEK